MREKMMPDIAPSVWWFEIEIHRLWLRVWNIRREVIYIKKIPRVLENSRGILEVFYRKTSTQQYHTVRWGYDAKML